MQIVHSSRKGSRDIEHIGSAHDDVELELRKTVARQLKPSLDNLAIAPDGTIYVSNMADNAVQAFNPATGELRTLTGGAVAVPGGLKAEGDPRAAGARFLDALQLFTRLVNIGDAKSLATHPASTTHRQLNAEELAKAGVTEGMVRLSVGIEHIDDLLEDLHRALDAV